MEDHPARDQDLKPSHVELKLAVLVKFYFSKDRFYYFVMALISITNAE
jgi:hypothetical protein